MNTIRVQRVRGADWYSKPEDHDGPWLKLGVPESATMRDVREYLDGSNVKYATARQVNQLLRQLS